MIEIDQISQIVTLDTEFTLSEIEIELSKRDYTLGYFVPPRNEVKLEEALSEKMQNLYSYGDISDLCISLQIHSKDQKNLKSFLAPRMAAGPDWKNFILGTGHSLGYIYKAALKIFKKPTHFLYLSIALPHDIASYALEQDLTRSELVPWVFARLGNQQLPKGMGFSRCSLALLTAWAGTKDYVDACKRALEDFLESRYSWKWLESKSLQKRAHQFLHEKYPSQAWGGPLKEKKEEGKILLEKKIIEALTYGN